MKIAAIGCSHSSSFTDRPWPIPLAENLNAELVVGASPGAGIGICVDKLSWILNNHKIDYVFFQAPSDIRQCIGMHSFVKNLSPLDGNDGENSLYNGNNFHSFIMTLVRTNDNALNNLIDNRTDNLWSKFDYIWNRYFLDTFYETKINFIKNLLQVQNLCKSYNVPYNIFTWHDFPWDNNENELFNSWKSRLDFDNINKQSVINFLVGNKMAAKYDEYVSEDFSNDGYHLNDKGSEIVVKEFILPLYK